MTRYPYRFYYPGSLDPNDAVNVVTLPEGESHHLLKVLRLKPGDAVTVFDKQGSAWRGRVEGRDGRRAAVALDEPIEDQPKPQARLLMAVSLLKRRAMDTMIEKLSELDVVSLQPLVCRRTVAKITTETQRPPARWERIALAAAKQAGRNIPMTFYPATPLGAWLQRERPPVLSCFAHRGEDSVGLGDWLGERAGMNLPVLVAVGPEGGWTPGEVEAFRKAGFQPVDLGPLVLRAETAAIAVAAACRVML